MEKKEDEAKNALCGLFLMAFGLAIFVFLPVAVLHKLEVEEGIPKTIVGQLTSLDVLPLEIQKTYLLTWGESQEVYPTSGILGFFKDKPSKGWLAYPGKAQIPPDLKNQKVWMKYVIKNRDLPIVEILEIRILKE